MFTVIKSNNKAWLKEDAGMEKPDANVNRDYTFLPSDEQDKFVDPHKTYNEHLKSLRTIQIAPEYVDYWAEGAKVKEGEYEVISQKEDKQIGYAIVTTSKQVAIPAQDEAGLTGGYYYDLFKFFLDEHGLTLVDTEICDIINAVNKFQSSHK